VPSRSLSGLFRFIDEAARPCAGDAAMLRKIKAAFEKVKATVPA
jgi:hypothetical protein